MNILRLIPSNIAKYIDYAEKKRSNDIIVLHNIILIGRHKNSSFPRLLLPIKFFHRTRLYLILQFPDTKAAKYRLHENDKSAFLTQHYSLEIAYAWDGAHGPLLLSKGSNLLPSYFDIFIGAKSRVAFCFIQTPKIRDNFR